VFEHATLEEQHGCHPARWTKQGSTTTNAARRRTNQNEKEFTSTKRSGQPSFWTELRLLSPRLLQRKELEWLVDGKSVAVNVRRPSIRSGTLSSPFDEERSFI
jgi:hypothetical protein